VAVELYLGEGLVELGGGDFARRQGCISSGGKGSELIKSPPKYNLDAEISLYNCSNAVLAVVDWQSEQVNEG
jgi:hypothetical protein